MSGNLTHTAFCFGQFLRVRFLFVTEYKIYMNFSIELYPLCTYDCLPPQGWCCWITLGNRHFWKFRIISLPLSQIFLSKIHKVGLRFCTYFLEEFAVQVSKISTLCLSGLPNSHGLGIFGCLIPRVSPPPYMLGFLAVLSPWYLWRPIGETLIGTLSPTMLSEIIFCWKFCHFFFLYESVTCIWSLKGWW